MDKILTLTAAADELKVSERYLTDKIKDGKLNSHKIGKRIYILYSDLITFVKNA